MKFSCRLFVCLFSLLSPGLTAQSPYKLTLEKELGITGAGLTTGLAGALLRSAIPPFTMRALDALDPANINSLDRSAVHNHSRNAEHASDIFMRGSLAAPLVLLADKHVRGDFATVGVLWSETVLTSSALTWLAKYAFRRTRPFVYDPSVSPDAKTNVDARASFFSGHTSFAAANTFFAAKVFSDYYPDSPWKPAVWGLAAAVPAVTGYLRVRAGRHFPTDVMAGYAVGALTGIFIPQWHRHATEDKKLSFMAGFNGFTLCWEIR